MMVDYDHQPSNKKSFLQGDVWDVGDENFKHLKLKDMQLKPSVPSFHPMESTLPSGCQAMAAGTLA